MTPHQPPPRECDRLFESGCALCGGNRPFPTDNRTLHMNTLSDDRYENGGRSVCAGCWTDHGQYTKCDAEITRRRALQSAQKFYGTQPSVLPKTLPDGVVWTSTGGTRCILRGNITLSPSAAMYLADEWFYENGGAIAGRSGGFPPKELDWTTVPLQSPAPPAAFAVGDEVEIIVGCNSGRVVKVGRIWPDGSLSLDVDGSLLNYGSGPASVRLIRPAASARPDPFRQTVKCDDCGAELYRFQACSRVRILEGGRREQVPGTFCAKCTEKPTPQPLRDPYAEHAQALRSRIGYADHEAGVHRLMIERDADRVPTRAERLRAQHLADLDRPIRTGPLLNRCRYGSLLSNHGWDSSDVDDELGCS